MKEWEAIKFGDDQEGPMSKIWPDVVERQYVRDQVNSGNWQLVCGWDGGDGFVYLVYSFESGPKGISLLVNGLFGFSGLDLVGEANAYIDAIAAAAGAYSIRLWTRRAGLVKKLAVLGYGVEMSVVEKVVDYG